jgi:hypothetical protein
MPPKARFLNTWVPEPRGETMADPRAEARRREIMNLLEEIRSDQPSSAEIVNAIKHASDGELTADRLQRIAGSVLALLR